MDLKELYAEMVKVATANPYRVPRTEADVLAGNLVAEKCAREWQWEGNRYNVVFSLNVIEVPKGRWMIFWPAFYDTHHFWHLTVTGYGVWPSDRLMQRFVDVFFIKGVEVFDATEDCRLKMGPLMPRNQRQLAQMVPKKVIMP